MSEKSAETHPDNALSAAQQTIARLEAELDEVNARLIRAEGGKSHFISHALNELNNPLAAIIGLAEQLMAMDQPQWKQVRQSLQWVHDESGYLNFQLRNLFMAAELEAGVAKAGVARVDVHSVLNGVTLRYLSLAQRKGVSIQCNGDHALMTLAGASRHFETDGAVLSLLYANLLDNAVKFSPPGGCVRVLVDINEAGLDLAIDDDGPGLSKEALSFVRDRFWQADSSTTKGYRGLGLGLSVSTSCAELLGGRLQISSAPDTGVRVGLHLPVVCSSSLTDTSDENTYFFDEPDMGDANDGERF